MHRTQIIITLEEVRMERKGKRNLIEIDYLGKP